MNKTGRLIYFIVCYVFFIFTDIYLSSMIVEGINDGLKIDNPVFSLNYVQNTGAAFNILSNSRELLIILSVVALILLLIYVFNHIGSISLKACFFISALSAGIAGNLQERIAFGYVRDYIQLNFVKFPIFNISDIFINVGVIALILLIILNKGNLHGTKGRKRR